MTWTLDALDHSSTLLTVNNRLAIELRARYDRSQAAAGKKVWPSADILPWNAWLQRLYQQLLDDGFIQLDLLSPAQERLLWEDIVKGKDQDTALLRPAAAAESAQSGYALYREWQLHDQPLASLGGDETHRFLGWIRTFEDLLSRLGLLSAAQLQPLLAQAIEQQALTIPRQVIHSGFDTVSPTQAALFDTLSRHGCKIEEHLGEPGKSSLRRTQADDDESEIRLAARWASGHLQKYPDARIGIVSPRITQQRRNFERLFTETVAPAAYLAHTQTQSLFNISLGEPLSEYPLVAHALLALRQLAGALPLHSVGQLLRSPFIGGHAGEWERRALLDAALREDGLPEIDLQRVIYRIHRFDSDDIHHCADLALRLERIQRLRRELPSSDTPSNWAGHFQTALREFGWPGDQNLDSHEFQQHERMRRVFSELAELGKVRQRMRLGEAMNSLSSLTADTLFQPQSPPAPIQILGPLEAAGMDFDAIWLLGMDDRNWPPAPHPHPLLPNAIQRDLGMPHASAARELAFASALTGRLMQSAAMVTASHARSEAEREQRPSALIRDWPVVEAAELATGTTDDIRHACATATRLEPMPMPDAGGAPAEPRGGAALLAAQASCPFSAVARFRLRAKPLEEPNHAPDGALIGSLVHELLQRVWQALKDSASLAGHDDASLQNLIAPLAKATLNDIGRRRPDLFTPRFQVIEAARLTQLVIAWLDVERRRAQPFEVEALEKDQTIELAGLQLRTRADRVDRLHDGSLAVIDYKTGRRVSNEGWFDQRLTEPQLPLYCLHSPGEVQAALLARVRGDERGCGFVGLSQQDDFAPGVEPPSKQQEDADWPDVLVQWQQALHHLASEIVAGRADPTPTVQACRYCALGALCRVQQMITEEDDG